MIKFGQTEFKVGDPERGRTVFEGLISKYSKKPDIWAIYLDMEIRQGDVGCCRYCVFNVADCLNDLYSSSGPRKK